MESFRQQRARRMTYYISSWPRKWPHKWIRSCICMYVFTEMVGRMDCSQPHFHGVCVMVGGVALIVVGWNERSGGWANEWAVKWWW